MRARRLQRPLAGGLPLPGVRLPAALPHPLPQAPAVQCLPPQDLPRRRQAAADRPVPGDPPADAGQARRFVAGTGAAAGRPPEYRLEGERKLLQVTRSATSACPCAASCRRTTPACRGGERTGGKRGRGAAGKTPFAAAVQVTAGGKPERMRIGSVAGFRKKTLAARADRHRRRQAELRGFPLRPGQHDAGERQAVPGGNLPFARRQAPAALPRCVPLPLQPPPRSRGAGPPLGPRLRAHPAHASPPPNLS